MVVVLGVPFGLWKYLRAVRREQMDREYGTYDALDDKYVAFQQMCLEKPCLNVFDVEDKITTSLTAPQKKEELILFTILITTVRLSFGQQRFQPSNTGISWLS